MHLGMLNYWQSPPDKCSSGVCGDRCQIRERSRGGVCGGLPHEVIGISREMPRGGEDAGREDSFNGSLYSLMIYSDRGFKVATLALQGFLCCSGGERRRNLMNRPRRRPPLHSWLLECKSINAIQRAYPSMEDSLISHIFSADKFA